MRYLAPAALALLVVAFVFAEVVRAQDKLRAAFERLAASHMVLLVGKDLRLFQKYNVEAKVVGHVPGASEAIERNEVYGAFSAAC